MIKSMNISGYKCFGRGTGYQNFGNINIFCGKNSSGKSSFLQPLLLLRQTISESPSMKSIRLNGTYLNLGDFEQIDPTNISDSELAFCFSLKKENSNFRCNLIYRFETNIKIRETFENEGEILLKSIEISGTTKEDTKFGPYSISFSTFEVNKKRYRDAHFPGEVTKDGTAYSVVNALDKFLPINSSQLKESFNNFISDARSCLALHELYFLSSARQGPVNIQTSHLKSLQTFSPDGSNSFGLYTLYFGRQIDPSLLFDKSDKLTNYEHQVARWINYIFDTDIDIKSIKGQIYTTIYNGHLSATNVGFGLSYALHIILLCLAPTDKKHIIIENPEAHLEPSAQYRLLVFLNRVSQNGCQLYIETHSDTLVNTIRLFAKENPQDKDNYKIFFISKTTDDLKESIIQEVNIEKSGIWPKGFFDQNQELLKKLHGI